MLQCADAVMYEDQYTGSEDQYTGSGRNNELIIDMNNILLRVINDNFSML